MTSETRPASKLTRCRVCNCKLKSGDICPRCEREQEWLNTPTADDSDVTYRDLLSREDLYTKVGRDARKAMLQQRQG